MGFCIPLKRHSPFTWSGFLVPAIVLRKSELRMSVLSCKSVPACKAAGSHRVASHHPGALADASICRCSARIPLHGPRDMDTPAQVTASLTRAPTGQGFLVRSFFYSDSVNSQRTDILFSFSFLKISFSGCNSVAVN